MPSPDYDLRYLAAGLEELERYLLSKEIYWPLTLRAAAGKRPYPPLTLGNLLLARRRAGASARTPTSWAELERLHNQIEALRSRWRTAWEHKAADEFRARLKLWGDFLEEYRQNPAANYDRYAYEVERRVLLHLLSEEAGELPPVQLEMLNALDRLLGTLLVPGEFIWDTALQPAFPRQTYGYLYSHLPEGPV